MAITIYTEPDSIASTKIPIVFEVVSDATDITKKIVADVYYRRNQSKFYRLAGSKEQERYPERNFFRFNFQGMLDKLLTVDYSDGYTGASTDYQNTSIEYYVVFTEYYPSSNYVAHGSLTTSTYVATQVGVLPSETQSIASGSDWYLILGDTKKFLTNSPNTLPIREGETIQLGFNTGVSSPKSKIEVTFNDNTSTTYTYTWTQSYTHKLWDFTVDENEVVTVPSAYIENLSGTSFLQYIANSDNVLYGGVKLVAANDVVDTVLPSYSLASGSVSFGCRIKAVGGTRDFEVYYWHGGVWNLSGSGTQTASTSYATFGEVMPAGTTKVRVKVIGASSNYILIPYMTISYSSTSIINRRSKIVLDSSLIDSTVKQVSIWVTDSSNNAISETKTFVVDREPVDLSTRFQFKNYRGEFDAFTFKFGHSESLEVEKVKFIKELPIGFSAQDRQLGVAYVNSDLVFTSYTDYDVNVQWLSEILESEEVYVIIDGVRLAVDILTENSLNLLHSDPTDFGITWKFANRRH